ncbi:Mitochondrial intermembrane space import and assembly protein 40 [Dermatophagoides pteronyssinus]|uniref:Mitochondrial intermembrane space import and assembly protein 40 n=1 Tax=Dermatophagoides pteronyssinus TaxID=6956 RepID=A0ABQ8IY92_DERPT|nr:Mitochondrial intermembrane space import and assembly protein 40 [Dermatophagoides pteronyssinus]
MSSCEQASPKDRIVFITKQDYDHNRSSLDGMKLPELPESEQSRGLIMPNGELNFNCPCLGGMASGPCGFEFREAFSCFHYSTNEVKGSECVDKFIEMNNCMTRYPNLYANENAAMNAEPADFMQSGGDGEQLQQQQLDTIDRTEQST